MRRNTDLNGTNLAQHRTPTEPTPHLVALAKVYPEVHVSA